MTEAYVVDAVRTPMGSYRGALSGVRPDDLAAHAIGAVVERTGVDPERITDVYFGAANQAGEDNRDVARMAALLAGLPEQRPRRHRQPALRLRPGGGQLPPPAPSRLGEGDFYLAGGVESMSRAPWVVEKPEQRPAARAADDARHDPRLAADQPAHGRARRLDRVDGRDRRERRRALRDQPRGAGRLRAAQPPARGRRRRGRRLRRGDRRRSRRPKGARDGHSSTPTRARGPTPRSRSSPALRPVFREGGTVTAGNASTLNDGAACTLIASEAGVEELGAEPLARVVATGVAGVDPAYMGIGPVEAIPRALAAAGLDARADRPDRDQRGLRLPGARLRPGARHRRGEAQRQRRRDRPRPPARLLRRPPRHDPGPRAAPPRRPLRRRHPVRRRRPGPGDGVRSRSSDSRRPQVP